MEDYLKTRGRIFDIQRYSIHDGKWNPDDRLFKGLRASLQMVLQSRISGI